MSIALSEFWTRLVRSGVTDAPGCKRLAAAFSQAHAGTPPSDAAGLAKFMVQGGKLTRFQADALLADPPREIRAGGFLIESASCPPPLSHWVRATRLGDRRSGFLLRATAEQLAGGRAEWLEAHQALAAPSLQPLASERHWTSTLVFSAMPLGRSLHDVIGELGRLAPRDACAIGIAIADALQAMQQRPLPHGSVRPDHVWLAEDGQVILLRDPSGPPRRPDDDSSASWIDRLDTPASFAAPEFAVAGQSCNEATDIYSLGCLMFRLASGRNPYDKPSIAETIAAHVRETPPELADAIARGESGDPLFRVIAYAMGKSPSARFASVSQLAGALRATLPLLPQPETDLRQLAAAVQPTGPAGKERFEPASSTRPASLSRGPVAAAVSASPPAAAPAAAVVPQRKPALAAVPAPAAAPTAPTVQPLSTSLLPPPAVAQQPASTRPPRRRRRKSKGKAPLVLGALCVAVLLLVIGLVVHDPTEPVAEKKKRPPLPAVLPPVTNPPPPSQSATPAMENEKAPAATSGYELVADERLLFVPPYATDTANAPLDLLPPGPQMIVSARLSSLRDSPLREALAAELDQLLELVASRAKVAPESISRCTAAMHPGRDGWPEVSLVIELAAPRPASELIEAWQVGASRTAEGATIYASDEPGSDAYYFPEVDGDSVLRFAVGSLARIGEVAAVQGAAIPLTRAFQSLWEGSSEQADLVLLIAPNFLFADGREMLRSLAPELVPPLRSLLQPDVAGALLIAHADDERVYAEARLAPSGGISEAALMRVLRESTEQWPTWAEEFIVDSLPDASWRLLASRLPVMMRFVVSQMRFGVSDGAAVANTYLPAAAVPQVALATLLAMNTPPSGAAAVASTSAARPLSVDEMLDRKMSVSFDQESLEFAIDAIATAFKQSLPEGSTMPPVRIIGGDLQLMGITQNQQVRDFAKSDLPLRTVLTDLVLGANADKTASGPQDPKQALIWVVADDPESPGNKAILVTTRQAAENRYDLPREFQPAN